MSLCNHVVWIWLLHLSICLSHWPFVGCNISWTLHSRVLPLSFVPVIMFSDICWKKKISVLYWAWKIVFNMCPLELHSPVAIFSTVQTSSVSGFFVLDDVCFRVEYFILSLHGIICHMSQKLAFRILLTLVILGGNILGKWWWEEKTVKMSLKNSNVQNFSFCQQIPWKD